MGYLLEHCQYGRLSPEIIDQCQPYKCSNNPDIDSFFHEGKEDNYTDYLNEMMGYSHCFYTDEEHPQMVCAFSLSNTALRIDVLPKGKRNKFNKSIPNPKRRSQYPAILIGQLCIFDGFGNHVFHQNIGNEMMDLIKTMAIDKENSCAARYLIVDAVNTHNVIEFYKRNGFVFLFESDEEELKYLRGKSFSKSIFKCHKKAHLFCKTRLMFFDLILLKTD